MRKPLNQKEFDEFLDLSPEHYNLIIKSIRPSDMDYEVYKKHLRTSKKLNKLYLNGRPIKKNDRT